MFGWGPQVSNLALGILGLFSELASTGMGQDDLLPHDTLGCEHITHESTASLSIFSPVMNSWTKRPGRVDCHWHV